MDKPSEHQSDICFTLNGWEVAVTASPNRRVLDLLREDFGLTGTKEGCGSGECGACTVLIDGVPRLSCLMLAAQMEGRAVTTIEGMVDGEELHPLQEAFVRCGAVQCGFCSPGMVLTAAALLRQTPNPTRDQIREGLAGNLCRCTGYQKIVDAVEDASRKEEGCAGHDASIPFPKGREVLSVGGAAEEREAMPPDAPAAVRPRRKGSGSTMPVFLPDRLEDLWSCMARYPESRVFAGGTDVFVRIRSQREKGSAMIGLERIGELQGIRETPSGLWIGAGSTHRQLLDDPRVRRDYPVLFQALRVLGSPSIRNMGTIGGNICTASPAGDTLPPLYVLRAELDLSTEKDRRTVPIAGFIAGPGQTRLRPGEVLTGIRLIRPEGYGIQHYEKIGQRKALACAIASMAALMKISPSGVIEDARFAWGSVGPTVVTSSEVEAMFIGERFSPALFEKALPRVWKAISPIDDVRASAEYRRRVAGNLLWRLEALAAAVQRVTA